MSRIMAWRYGHHHGYAMAALLVGLGVLAVTTSVALPAWQTAIRREREAELVFRGEQYVQAITMFQRRYAGTFPPDVVGSSRVDLQACKLEYSIVSPK